MDKLVRFWIQRQLDPKPTAGFEEFIEVGRLALQLPLTAGIRIVDRQKLADFLEESRKLPPLGSPKVEVLKPPYKNVAITRLEFTKDNELVRIIGSDKSVFLYHAVVDDIWCLSLREAAVKDLINRSVARREGKVKGETVETNSSLYLSPLAAQKAGDAVRFYLEWESHRRAVANGPIWYALYRSGLVSEKDAERVKQARAMKYLGRPPCHYSLQQQTCL